MEFPEFLIALVSIFSLFIGLPLVLFRGIAKLRESKGETGSALRRSELDALIGDAVDEATAELEARVAELEARLAPDDRRIDPSVLADALGGDQDGTDAPSAAHRRQRS